MKPVPKPQVCAGSRGSTAGKFLRFRRLRVHTEGVLLVNTQPAYSPRKSPGASRIQFLRLLAICQVGRPGGWLQTWGPGDHAILDITCVDLDGDECHQPFPGEGLWVEAAGFANGKRIIPS